MTDPTVGELPSDHTLSDTFLSNQPQSDRNAVMQRAVDLNPVYAPVIFGEADRNLRRLENVLSASVHARGTTVFLEGSPADVAIAVQVIKELESMASRGHDVSAESVVRTVQIVGAHEAGTAARTLSSEIVSRRGKVVRPKTMGQKGYVDAIDENTIIFEIGRAHV